MKSIVTTVAVSVVVFLAAACGRNSDHQNTGHPVIKEDITEEYFSVDDVYVQGELLTNKTVYVEGVIDHVCHNTWKRFKIIGSSGEDELKIELGDRFPSIDASITGRTAKVTGKLIAVKMDAGMVEEWKEKTRQNHKGEEDTRHYKEEIAFIQSIYDQIVSGEISYYTMYSVEADSYVLE